MAVGPVHAGVIEPGHFRFQCHGEHVFHLEISLGYQHRGVERALVGGPGPAHARTTWRRWPATRPSATRRPTARPSRRWPAATSPARAEALRGDRPGAGAARQPHRRPRRAGRRRGLPAHRFLLRAAPRRLPEPDGAALRQPLRPRPGPAGRRRRSTSNATRAARAAASACDRRSRDVPERRRTCSGTRRRSWRGSRTPARSRRETAVELGLVGAGGPGVRAGARRALRLPVGHLPLRADPGLHLARPATSSPARTSAGWRSSARPAFIREQLEALPDGPDPRAASGRRRRTAWSSRWSKAGAARSATWRSPTSDGRFAHYKVVDPSFHNWIGPGAGAARAADFRFPALQQELQPLVLRTRSVRQ